jgi:hypothetical protein
MYFTDVRGSLYTVSSASVNFHYLKVVTYNPRVISTHSEDEMTGDDENCITRCFTIYALHGMQSAPVKHKMRGEIWLKSMGRDNLGAVGMNGRYSLVFLIKHHAMNTYWGEDV